MPAEKKRVFVGNLPADTTQADVMKLFSNFGNVLSVEIKQHPNSKTFAFLYLKTDEDKLKSCFTTLAARKWNGNRLKLELAKESILSRLEKERQEHNRPQPHCSSDGDHMIDPSERSKEQSVEELIFMKNKRKAVETVCKLNDWNFDEDSFRSLNAASGSETLYNGKLKMFGGTRTAICDSDNDKTHSQSMPDSQMSQSSCAATGLLQRLTLFSDVWEDTPMNSDLIKDDRTIMRRENYKKQNPSDEEKRLLAEEKRKKSVDEKRKSSQKQKEAIKLSLSFVDSGHRNRKTVFDSEDHDTKSEDTVKQIVSNQISSLCYHDELMEKSDKKTILFDDASDDESDGNFKLKSQFEGSKGQKLLELQSHFASDKRFALDERFYESDEEVLADTNGTVKTAAGAEDERRRQFEILQDVLGHQIHIKDNKKDKYKRLSMLRFDPMNPDHAKFKKETEPTIKKKVIDISPDNKIPEVVCGKGEDRTENVLVSKEKYYTVAECLKESLRKQDEGNEFSLRRLFGASDGGSNDEESRVTYSATNLNKHKNWTINPFKYDSSDSEEETEIFSYNTTDNLQQNVHENVDYFGESFFFKASDPRLQEGLEFFNRDYIKDESYDFAKHRRELKQIVRSKVKNNMYNHRPWRKKLGGQKAKKFRKHKIS